MVAKPEAEVVYDIGLVFVLAETFGGLEIINDNNISNHPHINIKPPLIGASISIA